MKKTTINKTVLTITTSLILTSSSCKKFLDVGAPTTSINQGNVYQNDYTAAAALTGIYAQMMNDFSIGGITSISLLQDLASDNLVLNNLTPQTGYLNWYRNSFTPDYLDNGGFGNLFTNFYPKIYITNAAIEGISKSSTLTESVKKRLLGEAYFLRAFYYFYLVNLFGDVPLVLTTDYTKSSNASRSTISDVYNQITLDLEKANSLLSDTYVDGGIINQTSERTRPNLSASQTLLARVQLYKKNYSEAVSLATHVINKNSTYRLLSPDSVFQRNSAETIWSLQPVKSNYNTDEAAIFLLDRIPGTLGPKYFSLSISLVSSFESNDNRLKNWTGTFTSGSDKYEYAAKYKVDANTSDVSEYCIVFRLAELYLIRAEARAEINDITGATDDLNIIRKRAGLPPTTAATLPALRKAILQERRVEFFTEWGHRWFDIKRSGAIDSIMQKVMSLKGGSWSPYKALYPIPNSEIRTDGNLTQNPGY